MLSRVTTHCQSGHELVQVDQGVRTKKIPASQVLDVRSCGWCDVCIEPFMHEERWTCAQCSYDCCWRCHDEGKENYIVEMLTIPDFDGIYATMDVLKSKIAPGGIEASQGDDVLAMGAVLSFDCEVFDLTFGGDALESKMITDSSSVTFSKETGSVTFFEFDYINPDIEADYKMYGGSVHRFKVHPTALKDWEGYPTATDEPTLHTPGGTFFVIQYSRADAEQVITKFGSLGVRRFGLAEVPGFGVPEEKNTRTLKMLRAVAKDKRQLIGPMRRANEAKGAALSEFNCFGGAGSSSVANQSSNAKVQLKHVPVNNVADKSTEEKKAREIIDNLSQNQEEDFDSQTYKEQSATGKINHRDLIYCTRLSLLAYLTDRLLFNDFFPESREKYLLDPVWVNFIEQLEKNEGRELLRQYLGSNGAKSKRLEEHAHEAFLAKFISSFFVTDASAEDFALSQPLGGDGGSLSSLGLRFADLYPERKGREGSFKFSSIEGYVAESMDLTTEGGDIVFAFQGTNDFQDALVSLNGLSTPFEPMADVKTAGRFAWLQGGRLLGGSDTQSGPNPKRVHVGYYKAFLSFRPLLDAYLRKRLQEIPKDKHVRIVVTGHSLGGALAMVTMGWLLQLFDIEFEGKTAFKLIDDELTGTSTDRLRILCVTFGAPKVGNKELVAWMDDHRLLQKNPRDNLVRAKILRLIDVMDPIVTLPPRRAGFNYYHNTRRGATITKAGQMYFISREAADKYDETARGLGVIVSKGMTSAIKNHDLFLYLHKTMHFAWVWNKVSSEDDWDEDPIEKAFGASNYRYDNFTKSQFFLTNF